VCEIAPIPSPPAVTLQCYPPGLEIFVKRVVGLFAFTTMLASVLCGDWKIVTRNGNSTVTEFFKGTMTRTDLSPAYATVLDIDHRRQVNW